MQNASQRDSVSLLRGISGIAAFLLLGAVKVERLQEMQWSWSGQQLDRRI